ncbi:uncharacterized protein LOC122257994 [Penaeus japonicus]|uniref:uncharacterized protein LOC122257994 n=1 Tax=Penaeus japonicus TaxID=27405 RepID=UPI001C7145D4|nr:uncharacterized protein LOC122257994 [Penaeus japonicus]
MTILVLFSMFIAAASAAPQGYSLTAPTRPGLQPGSAASTLDPSSFAPISANVSPAGEQSVGVGISTNAGVFTETDQEIGLVTKGDNEANIVSNNEASASGSNNTTIACKEGEIRHVDGTCVVPVITRKVFVFNVPQQESEGNASLPELPPPKVEHNILFVRLPEAGEGPEPIIVPPPRQNNIVYVLNKQNEQTQRVIEVPAPPPSEPEIYFVDYEEGENPTLPGGVDLLTALGSASETGGEVVGVNAGSSADGSVVTSSIGEGAIGTTSGTPSEGSGVSLPPNVQSSSSTDTNIISENTGASGNTGPLGLYSTP